MKSVKFILCFAFLCAFSSYSETIAVPSVYTSGVTTNADIVAKFLRLELVKIEKFTVLDEFDLKAAVLSDTQYDDCFGKTCLIELGTALGIDYILSGSVEKFANKIVITLKLINVKSKSLYATHSLEFDNQEVELQRMMGITVQEMLKVPVDEETKKSLSFREEIILPEQVNRINNNGPRLGLGVIAYGELLEFYSNRSEGQGGLEVIPVLSNLGYQFEVQYIGTENFGALLEFIPSISGMDKAYFIPTLSIMNGFRFGKQGWEFAFGPTLGFVKTISGLIDPASGNLYTESGARALAYEEWKSDPLNWDADLGYALQTYVEPTLVFDDYLHRSGELKFNASWIMGIGRTFKAGALNIPLNVYYSTNKWGGLVGLSLGFNVAKKSKYTLKK